MRPGCNAELERLTTVGHVILPPGAILGEEQVAALLQEATSGAPKWGNIFNDRPPSAPKHVPLPPAEA